MSTSLAVTDKVALYMAKEAEWGSSPGIAADTYKPFRFVSESLASTYTTKESEEITGNRMLSDVIITEVSHEGSIKCEVSPGTPDVLFESVMSSEWNDESSYTVGSDDAFLIKNQMLVGNPSIISSVNATLVLPNGTVYSETQNAIYSNSRKLIKDGGLITISGVREGGGLGGGETTIVAVFKGVLNVKLNKTDSVNHDIVFLHVLNYDKISSNYFKQGLTGTTGRVQANYSIKLLSTSVVTFGGSIINRDTLVSMTFVKFTLGLGTSTIVRSGNSVSVSNNMKQEFNGCVVNELSMNFNTGEVLSMDMDIIGKKSSVVTLVSSEEGHEKYKKTRDTSQVMSGSHNVKYAHFGGISDYSVANMSLKILGGLAGQRVVGSDSLGGMRMGSFGVEGQASVYLKNKGLLEDFVNGRSFPIDVLIADEQYSNCFFLHIPKAKISSYSGATEGKNSDLFANIDFRALMNQDGTEKPYAFHISKIIE